MRNILHCILTLMAICLVASPVRGQFKSEYRVFQIKVENTDAGIYSQTITTYGEGTTDVVGKSDLKLKVLGITYQQAFRGNERWKENKLLHLASASNDNGNTHTLQVSAQGNKLLVKEGGKERTANAEAWSTSYWTLPPEERRNRPSFVLDADTGVETQVTWQNMGKTVLVIGGQRMTCSHYRVTGNQLQAELWYDENDRLVKREGIRKNKKITLTLVSATVR